MQGILKTTEQNYGIVYTKNNTCDIALKFAQNKGLLGEIAYK